LNREIAMFATLHKRAQMAMPTIEISMRALLFKVELKKQEKEKEKKDTVKKSP
jgi:hypothetical protein